MLKGKLRRWGDRWRMLSGTCRWIAPRGRIRFSGLSMKEITQTLEMVPRRHLPLWSVEARRNLAGSLQNDVLEVYSPERTVRYARKVGMRAELSIDLLTGWNLLDLDVRMRVVREIKVRRPKVLMMSPPCTWFSGLMNWNWAKISPPIREQGFRDATLHLEFCMLLADVQESDGSGWVLEGGVEAGGGFGGGGEWGGKGGVGVRVAEIVVEEGTGDELELVPLDEGGDFCREVLAEEGGGVGRV